MKKETNFKQIIIDFFFICLFICFPFLAWFDGVGKVPLRGCGNFKLYNPLPKSENVPFLGLFQSLINC